MATSSPPRRRVLDLAVAGAGLAVYALCALVASKDEIPALEREVFHVVNDWPDVLRLVAYPVQLLGVLVLPWGVAVVAAALRRWRLALALAVLPLLKYVVEFGAVKQTVDRARPFRSVCQGDPSCGHFRGVPLEGPSFVSGHAIIAAAVAVLVLPYLTRRWAFVVVLAAIGVGLARIYLGAHNPLDVIGGAAVGVVLGCLLNLAFGISQPNARPNASGDMPVGSQASDVGLA